MSNNQVIRILSLLGGKGSTALAILMQKYVPQMEYFFCHTYNECLERIKARLGIKIEHLSGVSLCAG